MRIEADDWLDYPREVVFRTIRDELPGIVEFIPDIEKVVVHEREDEGPGRVRFVNEWFAQAEIPKIAQALIKPDMLSWMDFALWDEKDWSTEWRLETKFFTERVKVGGKNYYVEKDGRTCFQMRGELKVDAAGMPGIPKLLQGKLATELEKFVVKLITPNLTNMTKGLREYLRAQA